MTTFHKISVAVLLLSACVPLSLHAQNLEGTWVRKRAASAGGGMTMTVEPCCHGGHRLTYHIQGGPQPIVLTVDSPFDGTEVPVMMGGKPSGETMAIKRLDDHHTYTVLKMNGKPFGTSKATLSDDGKTLNIDDEFTSNEGGHTPGKSTETWTKK